MVWRTHSGHYKRGFVDVSPRIAGAFDMQLYVEKQLIARRARLDLKELNKVQAQAVNRTATHLQKAMLKLLTARYMQPMAYFRRNFFIRRADARRGRVTGSLHVWGDASVPIEDYPSKMVKGGRKTHGGVRVRILRGEPFKVIKRSFAWAPHGLTLYFQRRGADRLPIRRMLTTSGLGYLAGEEKENGTDAQRINGEALDFLKRELRRQMDVRLQKLAHRMAEKHELQRLA